MIAFLKRLTAQIHEHRYGATLVAFLCAAVVTGAGCVFFMWAFEWVLERRLDASRIGNWCWVTTPLLFLLAVNFIRKFAPEADGAGIPQVVFASKHLDITNEPQLKRLIQTRTIVVKVIALLMGLWAGASTGREGPTVHVATGIFFGIMILFRKWFRLKFDLKSAIVAGGAAGLAAAFNTPLAGVTFAIEELSSDYFSAIKDYVLLAIIFASLTAILLTGEYTYFGKLTDAQVPSLVAVLLIGVLGGLCGAFFSTALIRGNRYFSQRRQGFGRVLVPVSLSLVLLILGYIFGSDMWGPGNRVAQDLVHGQLRPGMAFFALTKMVSTLVTYWSGMAGGIFAPCLAVGSSLGANVGIWMGFSTATCAMIGMAAFLSGTIQAPMTAFVIIFEMTGHHQMLVPIMLASLVAFMTARLLKAKHLYQSLATNYERLLS